MLQNILFVYFTLYNSLFVCCYVFFSIYIFLFIALSVYFSIYIFLFMSHRVFFFLYLSVFIFLNISLCILPYKSLYLYTSLYTSFYMALRMLSQMYTLFMSFSISSPIYFLLDNFLFECHFGYFSPCIFLFVCSSRNTMNRVKKSHKIKLGLNANFYWVLSVIKILNLRKILNNLKWNMQSYTMLGKMIHTFCD